MERWRPVIDHAGYEVSDLGNVRGLRRRIWRRAAHKCPAMWINLPARTLKVATGADGRRVVCLGLGNSRYIAVLVLEAFLGPRRRHQDYDYVIDTVQFLDGDKSNDALSNLAYKERSYV